MLLTECYSPSATHRVLLTEFVSMACSITLKSMILAYLTMPDYRDSCNWIKISWTACLLYFDQLNFHRLPKEFFCLLPRHYGLVRTRKAEVPKLDYVVHSFVRFLNHIRSETMHNVSAHHLPRYHQQQRIPTMAWTALVMWYTHHKQAHTTKIEQNFWLVAVINF